MQAAVCLMGFVFRSNGCFKKQQYGGGGVRDIECEIMRNFVIRQR